MEAPSCFTNSAPGRDFFKLVDCDGVSASVTSTDPAPLCKKVGGTVMDFKENMLTLVLGTGTVQDLSSSCFGIMREC